MASTPYAEIYGTYMNQAHNAYTNALISTQAQRTTFLNNQGVVGKYDPITGKMSGFDYGSNPTGQYQQTLAGMAGTSESMQSSLRNIGFKGGLAGAHQQAADSAAGGQLLGWQQRFLEGQNALNAQDTQAGANYENSLAGEKATLAAQGAKAGDFGAADTSGITVNDQGQGVANPTGPGNVDSWGNDPPPGAGGGGNHDNQQMVWKGGKIVWVAKNLPTRIVMVNGKPRRVLK